ncbi:hypothetical protein QBZ16_002269 [Prototheca wickerhamii]|uniref:Fungal lipase-type domain-containing protein n=1 Tax=Prototheca wickerhamii TaxID=3111 RepID=A0AAD9MIA8_PROWI|nr:hypothetical protein QBZ16_002269 [Prototheca wickerhamii]
MEDLYYFAEGLRYTYSETLGRWGTADLLIGLTYLCRRDPAEHVNSEVALSGEVFGRGMDAAAVAAARRDLREIRRVFHYCMGMRERRAGPQRAYFNEALGIGDADILRQEVRAGVLKPSFVLVRDEAIGAIVLIVRGTHSFKDMFTSLTGAAKPHHLFDTNGVVLGYAHFGMLAAARWVLSSTAAPMAAALEANPHLAPRVVGHSLGAGTAALLTMMLRERGGVFAETRCVAVACPACMTLELARSCAGYVTTVINRADVIPTVSPGSADRLRREVTRSAWAGALRAELRATGLGRVLEVGRRRHGGQAPRDGAPLKRRASDEHLAEAGAEERGSALSRMAESVAASSSAATSPILNRLQGWWARRGDRAGASKLSDDELEEEEEGVKRDASVASPGLSRAPSALLRKGGGVDSLSTECAEENHPGARADANGHADSHELDQSASESEDEDPIASPRGMRMASAAPDGRARRRGPSPSAMARHVRAASRELHYEASARMSQVEAAVESAERARWFGDAEGGSRPPSRGEAEAGAVPAVFPPGDYGSRSSPEDEAAWRRALYPAGRIIHLVPAHLVPRRDEGFELVGAMEGEADDADQAPSEEPADAADGPLAGKAAVPEDMILLDNVPHTLYGRIRLCRQVLSDHIIPNYLASLESALERLPASFQESSESESDAPDALELGMLDDDEPHPMMEDV